MEIKEMKKKLLSTEKHDLESLRLLVAVLRSEEGCPWDREQTHASIRNDLIEETYEVIEGIDDDNSSLLREELGDVLFQVVFHSQIEEEAKNFDMSDVIDDVAKKMIYRHPHVFGDVEVKNSSDVLDNWEKNKKVEKSRNTTRELLESVPKQYPALIRSRKVIKKARKEGYDFGSPEEISENIKTLAAALDTKTSADRESAIADIIWNCVILASADTDLEKDISDRINVFIDKF